MQGQILRIKRSSNPEIKVLNFFSNPTQLQMAKDDVNHIPSTVVDAKLRMYANGSQEVNEIRAGYQGGLSIKKQQKYYPQLQANLAEIPPLIKSLKKKKAINPPDNILTNVFVRVTPDQVDLKVPGKISEKGNIISARLSLTQIHDLKNKRGVVSIESGRPLRHPTPKIESEYPGKPEKNILQSFKVKPVQQKVLIGIIDVGGFDFSHSEFLDKNNQTRFVAIWDQGGDFREPPKGFDYGAEFNQAQLNQAIKDSKKLKIPAFEIEKQSDISVGSHGTHVASIAAGKSGVCPDALIAGVLISLKPSELDRRKSFYDSACIVHAVDYLSRLADSMQLPLSINISLGTNGHAHDGSDAMSRWIDSELLSEGRCVTVAAGNAGQEAGEAPDDYGYIMGRIHTSGKIKSRGLTSDIEWCVVGNNISDVSENELEVWYPSQDRFAVSVKPPGMEWLPLVKANEFIENLQLQDGSFVSVYNDLYHPANGNNCIAIFLSPNYNKKQVIPIRAGIWQVRLHGEDIRNGEYHAWIERDDPRPLGPTGDAADWNFPSFFSEKTNVDNTSISSLACARYIISVGNYDHINERINKSSSQGPTRDGRTKPEVIAPGTKIVAAKGFGGLHDPWVAMSGTSMAAPIVCGVAAQMLAVNSKLTAPQISGIMIRTSKPVPGTDYHWKNDLGFGIVDANACVVEAKQIGIKKDLKK